MKLYFLSVIFIISFATANAQQKIGVIQKKSQTVDKKIDSGVYHRNGTLKEVVVTGQYQPQSLKNSVYQTRIISAERIRLRAATNIQQVLNTELGFRFSNDMTLGTSDVQLMGMSGRNVKILLDGVPMVDRSDTRESLNQIDINSVERIEIVEGPLSVSYGTDALAGVINIITKKPGKENLSINARVQEETAGGEYAPFSKKGSHIQHIGADWQNKGFSVLGGLTHNEFNGFKVPGPMVTAAEIAAETNRWKPKEQWLTNTRVGYSKDNFNVWYRLDYLDETIKSKSGYNPNNYKAVKQEYNTDRYTQQLQGDYRFNERLQLSGMVAYSNLKRATVTRVHDYSTGTEELSAGEGEQDISKFRSASIRTTLQYKMSDRVSFQPGIDVNLDHSSGARIEGSPSINDYAFFISSEVELFKDVVVRPGLRFIGNSVYNAPPVIPSLNTKIKLNEKLDLRFGYASGFRSPALRELYYDFFDANHSILGNQNLKAEESNSFNASLNLTAVSQMGLHFRSVLSGFYNNFRNRIGYGEYAEDPAITTLINIAKYKTTGGTWENSLFAKNFYVSLGFSMIGAYNEYSNSATLYGESPEFVWSPEISSNITYTFSKLDATINLAYKYTGETPVYQLVGDGEAQKVWLAKTAAFNMADLMVTKKLLKSLTLNAGVQNLLNVTKVGNTAVDTGSAHSTGTGPIPMSYGRSYVIGLNYNWNKN